MDIEELPGFIHKRKLNCVDYCHRNFLESGLVDLQINYGTKSFSLKDEFSASEVR